MLVYLGGKYKHKYLAVNIPRIEYVQIYVGDEFHPPSLSISLHAETLNVEYETYQEAEKDMIRLVTMSNY